METIYVCLKLITLSCVVKARCICLKHIKVYISEIALKSMQEDIGNDLTEVIDAVNINCSVFLNFMCCCFYFQLMFAILFDRKPKHEMLSDSLFTKIYYLICVWLVEWKCTFKFQQCCLFFVVIVFNRYMLIKIYSEVG